MKQKLLPIVEVEYQKGRSNRWCKCFQYSSTVLGEWVLGFQLESHLGGKISFFFDYGFSGEAKEDLGGLRSRGGSRNSWYHSRRSIGLSCSALQNSKRSSGERRMCCLPLWFTSRANGKHHEYLRSFSLSLSRSGLIALFQGYLKGLEKAISSLR